MKNFFAPFAALTAVLMLAGLAWPSEAAREGWNHPDADAIAAVETYIDGISTLRATFVQIGANGALAEGTLWLSRPGRARFEYAPPVDVLLVADGTWLIYYDAELDQVSHLPLGRGPFRFLLSEDAELGDDVSVLKVERANGLLTIELADASSPGDGTVTMLFEEDPMRLRQWQVLDAQGKRTTVTLHDVEVGPELDRRLFRFTHNDRQKADFRLGTYQTGH